MSSHPTFYMREESYKGKRIQTFQLVGEEEGLYNIKTRNSEVPNETIFSLGEELGRHLRRRCIFTFGIANQQEYDPVNNTSSTSGDPIPLDKVESFRKGVESMVTRD